MRLLAAVVVGLVVTAASAGGADKQVIRYHGIYCDTGRSKLGTGLVACRPHDGNGYSIVMNAAWFELLHNGDVVLLRRNR